jgi:CheY-specific phosphatase CheX
MPDSPEGAALSAATRNVLETMVFTDVSGERPGHASGSGAALDVRLRFAGERPGEFRITLAMESARAIAGNFLGLDDEGSLTESDVGEVACELANMICGSVLSHLAGDLAFDLSHPAVAAQAGDVSGWPEAAARTFDLDNGWLTAAIRFEQP